MTDDKAAALLRMSRRNLLELRAKGVLPDAGAEQDQYLDAYIPHLRTIRSGHVASAEKVDLDLEKARLAREQADQVAMKNALTRGDLVELGPIRDAMVGAIEVMKSHLFRIPKRLFPSDPVQRQRAVEIITETLVDLSAERVIQTGTARGSKRR